MLLGTGRYPLGRGLGPPPLTIILGGVSAAKLPTSTVPDGGHTTPARSDPARPCLARRHCPPSAFSSVYSCSSWPLAPGGLKVIFPSACWASTPSAHGGLLWHRPSHLPLLLPDTPPRRPPTCQHLGQVRAPPRYHPALAPSPAQHACTRGPLITVSPTCLLFWAGCLVSRTLWLPPTAPAPNVLVVNADHDWPVYVSPGILLLPGLAT